MTEKPNIVKDYQIGGTRIMIADNFCSRKSADDVKQILRDVARKAQRSISAVTVTKAAYENHG